MVNIVFLWIKGNSKKETKLYCTTASCSTRSHWFYHHPAVCIQGGEGVCRRCLRESHHSMAGGHSHSLTVISIWDSCFSWTNPFCCLGSMVMVIQNHKRDPQADVGQISNNRIVLGWSPPARNHQKQDDSQTNWVLFSAAREIAQLRNCGCLG